MHKQSCRRAAVRRRGTALALATSGALLASTQIVAAELTRPGAIALRDELHALLPPQPKLPQGPVAMLTVTSCADDDGSGTLRAKVAAAGEGDTVDLGGLACSTITLSQGAVPVLLNDLTLTGPAGHALAIDGGGSGRVFAHPGSGALTLRQLVVRNGASVVSGNHVTGGGCIASSGYVVLDHSSVTGCYAAGEGVYGGAVFAAGLKMYTSTLSRNIGRGLDPGVGTAVFGGGAYAAQATLSDSTVSGNRADFAASGAAHYDTGGGLFTNLGGTVLRSTIDGNYSADIGGGMATFGGYLDVLDSTIAANSAATGSGGGLDLRAFYGGRIANSTIAGNHAAAGGGVYLRGRPDGFVLNSTIVSGNTAGQGGADFGAVAATTLIGANNLVVAGGIGVTLPADTRHADPLLLALANNGGPTRTLALAAGSPALDAGNNVAGLSTDQRGLPRSVGAAPDIGAFEGFIAARAAVPAPFASRAVLILIAAWLALAGGFAFRRRKPRAA